MLAACTSGVSDGPVPAPVPPSSGGPSGGETLDLAVPEVPAVVGQDEAGAEAVATAAGLILRVVSRDGEDLPHTMDYRTDRVNVVVLDGLVVDAFIG
jgi:hypothetical protein